MEEKPTIFCGQCGTKNPKQNKFCFNCGKQLLKIEESNALKHKNENAELKSLIGVEADVEKIKLAKPELGNKKDIKIEVNVTPKEEKYLKLKEELVKLIEYGGFFIAFTKDSFIQFFKEKNNPVIIFDLGYASNFGTDQIIKLKALGFEISDTNLNKSVLLTDNEVVLNKMITESKQIFENIFNCHPTENFDFEEEFENKKNQKSKTLIKLEEIGEMDQPSFNRKYGWYLGIAIIIICLIFHFSKPKAEREAETAKKEVENNFNYYDGSHLKLVEYTKQKLRDPESFEHIETNYTDNGQTLSVTMIFRCNNGFGGKNNDVVNATCDK
ncbi:hypothetical protein A5893_17185 [Pedobacter psychrophilus]|uniref:Zinc-ribbon domain-containing protein n=1 Tax=Pedobacter psychrophilus TaxID=1826909 RepID=A0A179DS23_9SPHI|nr:zinc ribbon domain-containing protein [Pedobacter psychrophilus]OAQ43520.1 hypothetical protein A5893_17185 [Pedobacter psychrophilus]